MAHQTLKAPISALSQIPFSRPPTPHASLPRIGFCGIGAMGRLMARNLANHQGQGAPPLLIYNRTVSKSQSLTDEMGSQKVAVALRPEQLVTDCDIIITSLSSDGAVKSVYESFAQALKVLFHIPRNWASKQYFYIYIRIRILRDTRSSWKHQQYVLDLTSFPNLPIHGHDRSTLLYLVCMTSKSNNSSETNLVCR